MFEALRINIGSWQEWAGELFSMEAIEAEEREMEELQERVNEHFSWEEIRTSSQTARQKPIEQLSQMERAQLADALTKRSLTHFPNPQLSREECEERVFTCVNQRVEDCYNRVPPHLIDTKIEDIVNRILTQETVEKLDRNSTAELLPGSLKLFADKLNAYVLDKLSPSNQNLPRKTIYAYVKQRATEIRKCSPQDFDFPEPTEFIWITLWRFGYAKLSHLWNSKEQDLS